MAAPAAAGSSTTSLPRPPPSDPQNEPQGHSAAQPSASQQPQTQLPPGPAPLSLTVPGVQQPPLGSPSAATSPQKTGITNWWKGLRSKNKKGEEQEPPAPKGIFGVSLNTSIQYAYVNISITNASGNSEVYGRIPIIVAKCGVFLKEKATDVEGIFRVSGSAKRIKELQSYFDSPPTYGKNLEWDGFNVHDAANVFRRYINHLPEPIIPYDYYFSFRKPLEKENPDTEETIKEYQRLIGDLPRLNGQLLLYILDLLAVFAETSALNLMPAANLAAIFQPGLLSHADHDMNPQEYRVSQEVLIFLIQHQDRFLPTTAQRPPAPSQPQQPSPQTPQPPKQPPTSTQTKPTSKAANQPPGPPAKYSGVYPPKESETLPRRRTLSKNTPSPEQKPGWGGMLRRNQSSRSPQSPKLGVEQEEPRRLSEGSERASAMPAPIEEDESLTTTRSKRTEDEPELTPTPAAKDERSSPVTQSDSQTELASKEPTDDSMGDQNQNNPVIAPAEDVDTPAPLENHQEENQSPSTGTGAQIPPPGNFLAVKPLTIGRSSSYREELDEIIEYPDPQPTTSADNTETETSDADKPSADTPNRKTRRRSRLPWSSSPASGSSEKVGSTFFSFASTPLIGDDGKPLKKLKKKKRPKQGDLKVNAIGIAVSVGGSTTADADASTNSITKSADSERGAGTLSPPPWVQQSNISQSSLNASDFSRRSHLSSNRSSIEGPPRSATPVGPPTTFAAMQHSQLVEMAVADKAGEMELPTDVNMPAVAAEKQRTSSQSSVHSAASSGKGSKIGAWLRKKRGFSVSSSTSAGGGSSAVSD